MTPGIDEAISVYIRRFIGRYYIRIVTVSLILTALAGWLLVSQWNINSDFKALLPQDSEAAEAMREVGDRIGSGSALFVVIDSPDMDANKEFASDFAERLRQMDEVSLAHFRNKLSFFEKRQLLFLEKEDLAKIRKRLKKKIDQEKKEANPLFASLDDEDDEEDEDFIKLDDIRQDYRGLEYRDHREYMISEDGFSLTMIVRFSRSSTDLAATNKLIQKVKDAGRALNPKEYHSDLELEYGGGLINRQQDYETIATDIRDSALFTLVGLFLVISLYFRRKRATALVMVPLVMAVVWTLAIAFMIFDELTTVSAFIFAILLGLGIDYSIHLLSGYDHARLEGKSPIDALTLCYQGVGSATVIGAFTTFATFVVLSFAQFRGLSQFGQVASIGVVMTVLAMVSVMPALLMTFDHFSPRDQAFWSQHSSSVVEPVGSRDSMGKAVPVAVTLVVVFSGLALFQFDDLKFEENFRKLGEIHWPWERIDRDVERQREDAGASAADVADHVRDRAVEVRKQSAPDSYEPRREQLTTEQKYKSAMRGERSSTPTLILFEDKEDVREVFNYMQRQKREGNLDTVLSISSIYGFMPGTLEKQRQRMTEIERIEEMLDSEDLSVLDDDAQERVEEFQKKLDVQPFTIRNLPLWVKKLFKEAGADARKPADGEPFAYEYVIYVSEGIDQMRGVKARKFLDQLNDVRQEFPEVDFQIGSQSYIYVAMLDEIKDDGPKMISIALVCVFIILAFAFRSPLRGLVALLPLMFGGIWMLGLISFIGLRLDFFNVVIIPVVIGIGVDAGVHFYRRYLERGEGSGGMVLRLVGSAVAMASITSMVGFGGLAITGQNSLQSIGWLALFGIGSTFLATVTVMPVLIHYAERHDIDWLLPDDDTA